jgi:DNA-binding NarL/FixJ family response regulator
VAAGGDAWSREEQRRAATGSTTSPQPEEVDIPLTQRETEVLQHLARGLTNKQIGAALGISFETVKEHVQHVLRKIGVSDRTQAAVWAVRKGMA